jgi:hypothetical protein
MAPSDDIAIEVVEADALTFLADVLVLKYAQALHGVDADAVDASGLDPSRLPPPGGYRPVSDPKGIGADLLLFVGVVPLREFGYGEIRDFGHRALRSVAGERPDARSIALTLHGAGHGLDEIEAFDSELAGILDAIHDRDVPPALERVVIVEANPSRAARLKSRLQAQRPRRSRGIRTLTLAQWTAVATIATVVAAVIAVLTFVVDKL